MKTLSNIIMKLATGTFIALAVSVSLSPVQADNNPWEPKGIAAVWANGRGPAHVEFLRNDYSNRITTHAAHGSGLTYGSDAIWRNAHSQTFPENPESKSDVSVANRTDGISYGTESIWRKWAENHSFN